VPRCTSEMKIERTRLPDGAARPSMPGSGGSAEGTYGVTAAVCAGRSGSAVL
jgi:hypothetical protein